MLITDIQQLAMGMIYGVYFASLNSDLHNSNELTWPISPPYVIKYHTSTVIYLSMKLHC